MRLAFLAPLLALGLSLPAAHRPADPRPNILFFLTDDQAWLHVSAYGDVGVETPAFDQVAARGALFEQAFAPAPSCTPSRSAILTGQDIWRLREGGQFGSSLPAEFAVFPLLLEDAGYFVGWTGKGWGPGNLEDGGWKERVPLSKPYNTRYVEPRRDGHPIFSLDYTANFDAFLKERPEGAPFFFWCGTVQPHRPYTGNSGLAAGKKLEDVVPFPPLPDDTSVRADLLDYYLEIEYGDAQLARMLALLAERGELDNTFVVVTSDNGIAVVRGKGNLYDLGTRVPLAVSWPARIPAGQRLSTPVNLIDFAPTFLEIAGVAAPTDMTGRSLLSLLGAGPAPTEDARPAWVVTALENDYPTRALRTESMLYLWNIEHERPFPMGALPSMQAYYNAPGYDRCVAASFGVRPEEELYDLDTDPWQLENLAGDPGWAETLAKLRTTLREHLAATGDPRLRGENPFGPMQVDPSPLASFGVDLPRPPSAELNHIPIGQFKTFLRNRETAFERALQGAGPEAAVEALGDIVSLIGLDTTHAPQVVAAYKRLLRRLVNGEPTETASRVLERCRELLQAELDAPKAAQVLHDHATLLALRGEAAAADALFRATEAERVAIGDQHGVLWTRNNRAVALREAGDPGAAFELQATTWASALVGRAWFPLPTLALELDRSLTLLEAEAVPAAPFSAASWDAVRTCAGSSMAGFLSPARLLHRMARRDRSQDVLAAVQAAVSEVDANGPVVRIELLIEAVRAALARGAVERAEAWLARLDEEAPTLPAHILWSKGLRATLCATRGDAAAFEPLLAQLEAAQAAIAADELQALFGTVVAASERAGWSQPAARLRARLDALTSSADEAAPPLVLEESVPDPAPTRTRRQGPRAIPTSKKRPRRALVERGALLELRRAGETILLSGDDLQAPLRLPLDATERRIVGPDFELVLVAGRARSRWNATDPALRQTLWRAYPDPFWSDPHPVPAQGVLRLHPSGAWSYATDSER